MFDNNKRKVSIWGLDLSDKSLKLIGLNKKGNNYSLVNLNSMHLPSNYFDNGKIVNEKEIIKIIKELINLAKGPKLKSKFIHACLPEKHTFIKLISIPPTPDNEIHTAVEWAAEHHLPFALDELYFDWQKIGTDKNNNEINILIGAAPKNIVDSYTSLLKKADLIPLSLEIEALSIIRAMLNNNSEKNNQNAVGIIDIGATRSSFIIYANNTVQSIFSLPLAGDKITEIISQKLSLDPKQAEEAKIVCGLDENKCKDGIHAILNNELNELANKIKSAIDYYNNNFANSLKLTKILLCGGGAEIKKLESFLSKTLGIETVKGNPFAKITNLNKITIPENEKLSYTTAIGLALKM